MSTISPPLIVVALASAALVLVRGNRLALGALLVQWLGLIWAGELVAAAGRPVFGLSTPSAAELVTAAVSVGILGLTLRGIRLERKQPAVGLNDYLLRGAAVLMAGIAGVGVASLFPLGVDSQVDLALYWAGLSGGLLLILDGARSPVRLAVGLLALLNTGALLVYALSDAAPGVALLGLLAALRVGLAVLMAYGWLLLVALYDDLSLDPLFSLRDTGQAGALAVVVQPAEEALPPTEDAEPETPEEAE